MIMDETTFTELTWDVITAYFDDNSLVKHQVESFNDFVLRKIDEIIEGFNPIEVHHQYLPEHEKFKHMLGLTISNPILSKPVVYEKDGSTKIMTPNDARLRNFSYSAPLNVDIEVRADTYDEELGEYVREVKKLNNINLGKVPIMVGSRYCVTSAFPDSSNVNHCRYDVGGYFVINGNEKVVVSQDRICENKTHVFTNTKQTAYSHIAEIRSVSESRFGVPKTTTLKLSAKANQFGRYIRMNIHHIKHDIPLFVMFRALGIESDKNILEYIVYNTSDPKNENIMREMVGTIDEAQGILCSRDALEYLSKYLHINGYPKEMLNNKPQRLNIIRTILEKEFLPHVGTDFRKKALYLGYMVNKLVRCYLGEWDLDDRDSYINKRVDSPGVLMANLFRQYFGKMVKDMKNMIQKELNSGSWKAVGKFGNIINKVNVYKIIKSTVIESGLKFALATGNWGIKNNKNKQGVAQVLNRMTYNATLSHLRRINTPIEKTGKLVQPRKLHATQWGYVCPSETPEGASVGLVKNMSMTANISIAANSCNVRTVLEESGMDAFDGTNISIFWEGTKVIVNGDILGVHDDPAKLYKILKDLKRMGAINIHTGVTWNIHKGEININTEGGRCVRPLYIVEGNRLRMQDTDHFDPHKKHRSWREIVLDGCIEYLDVEETNLALIAMKLGDLTRGDKGSQRQPKYTHMEIHPSLMLGVLAGSIPFSDHNQAPRNTYQCLGVTETVLMANGDKKMIKDVREGDEVITFDNKTMYPSVTKVIHQYVRPTENKIYEVETISGRKITATGNHKFMTTEGWKATETFDTNTKIGVFMNPEPVSHEVEEYLVLDEDMFKERLTAIGLNPSLIPKHAKKLANIGLLPLTSTHKHLGCLARMAATALTDGSINIYNKTHGGWTGQVQANFGAVMDAELFEDDVKMMGFKKVKIIEQNREVHPGEFHHTWMVCHNGHLPSLMLALGVSYGNKKTTPRKPIPDWIMKGSKYVKREFLSAFQGGDGCKMSAYERTKGIMTCPMTYQSTEPKLIDYLMAQMNQVADLLRDFDIDVLWVQTKDVKDKITKQPLENRVRACVKISDCQENLVKYFETVGYRYTYHKITESGVAIEYYKYKRQSGENMPFDRWMELVEVKGNSIFVPIKSITEVENQLISDITVEHDNHSFIAGVNFLSGNSAMGKQAIGVYASNFRHRFDTMAHVLNYPQKPIVETKISKIINTDEMPCGVNVIVAIMTYTGLTKR